MKGRDIMEKNYNINREIFTLSSLTNAPKTFMKFAQISYFITDFLCNDYPKYLEWFCKKQIPGLFNGTREIVLYTIDNKVAGVAFLKKDSTESKLCTLFIVEEYRRMHIATKILEYSFKYLGTTKPLASINEFELPLFENIIKKYNWKLTQIKKKGYYNNFSREFVYNGKIS